MTSTQKEEKISLNSKLLLESSFKDNYHDGKWYHHPLEQGNMHCFAFSPSGPVLEVKIFDGILNKEDYRLLSEKVKIKYHPEYDSVSLLDRSLTSLRSDKPSFGYFKRLGYWNSDGQALFYYLSTPLRGIIGLGLDMLMAISIFGAGAIKGKDWLEDYLIASQIAKVGLEIRTQKLLEATLNPGWFQETLISMVEERKNDRLRRVMWNAAWESHS